MQSFDQKFGSALVAAYLFCAFSFPAYSAAPIFARFSADRATIFEGEAFQVTLAIYITGETLAPQISIDALPPPHQLQLYPFQELPMETTTVDGHPCEIRKFRAWARAPKAGTVSLAPRLNGTFIQTTRTFFMMQESRRPASIPVEALALIIRPLPDSGRPADFSGLVGRFAFSVVPTPLNIALGDLITVTFTIEGDLLPDTYLKPSIRPLPELKIYDLKPVAGESTPVRQVFNQTVVPGNSNITTIPACSLSFYDTRQLCFKTLTAGPFPIRFHAERLPVQTVFSSTGVMTNAGSTNAINPAGPSKPLTMYARLWQWVKHEKTAIISGKEEVQVFLTPSESSKKLFTLKPGDSVTPGATYDNWVCVSSPAGTGWIPTTAITP